MVRLVNDKEGIWGSFRSALAEVYKNVYHENNNGPPPRRRRQGRGMYTSTSNYVQDLIMFLQELSSNSYLYRTQNEKQSHTLNTLQSWTKEVNVKHLSRPFWLTCGARISNPPLPAQCCFMGFAIHPSLFTQRNCIDNIAWNGGGSSNVYFGNLNE